MLIFCIAVSFTGCRESLVIAKIIHDQQAEEQDSNATALTQNDPESDNEDQDLPSLKNTDADSNSDQVKEADTKGDETNPGTASNTVHDSDSSKNVKADKSGSRKSNKNNKNSKKKKGTNGSDDSGKGDDDAGQGGDRQIYDDDGNIIDLPEDVNSVVAPGTYAVIVQMLGGKDILAGSSSSVTGNSMMQTVFAGEGINSAQTYWSGDGSSPMSSGNFNSLLAKKPDVCAAPSGSFSSSQISQLKSKGIAYVTLPSLDTPEHIEKAVSITGKMLGNRTGKGGQNANKLANNYQDYCESLTKEVSSAVGSSNVRYSLYISGWDDSATLSIASIDYSETGLAYTSTGNKPVQEYMEIGGATDNTSSYTTADGVNYAVVPLNLNKSEDASVDDGLTLLEKSGRSISNRSLVRNTSYNLGNSKFKYVIADSQSTKDKILASASGSGMWTPFSRVTAVNGESDYGFLDDSGYIVRTNIRGSYSVEVNPSGVCSWAEGSPESVLESIWTAWKISGKYSESDVRNEVADFYSTFYRYDLSNSETDAILAGKE